MLTDLVVLIRIGWLVTENGGRTKLDSLTGSPRDLLMSILQATDTAAAVRALSADRVALAR